MKALSAFVAIGLGLVGVVTSANSQPYEGRDYGYREYRGDRDRDYGYRSFDERGYLRCNRDVRAAIDRGEFDSGLDHYRRYGRRENRRFSC